MSLTSLRSSTRSLFRAFSPRTIPATATTKLNVTLQRRTLATTSNLDPAAVASQLSSMASTSRTPAPEPTLFIDGKWTHAKQGHTRPIINPYDGSTVTVIDEAGSDDALAAVASAAKFFRTSSWPHQTCTSRTPLLSKVADLLQRDKQMLAEIETKDTGKTLEESKVDVDDVTNVFRFYAEEAKKLDQPKKIVSDVIPDSVESTTSHVPVGVCVLIAPWNYPLLQICWKVAPALATGNAVIIKPSEVTPLSTIHFVKLLVEAGAPTGSVQLLTAGGASVGPTLTEHADVDLVSFTGGLDTGRRIIASCAGTVKRCTVELGGKNPNVVFADCDLEWAIDTVTTAVFLHSGQVCSSGARLIVEESIADKLVAGVVERAKRIHMGNGMDPASETGPLVSAAHLSKVEAYVQLGVQEGAKLMVGGSRPDPKQHPELAKGFFFCPTVFDHCHRDMRIVQEETFGPILTVERFKDGDEEHAIFLANDTKYGLAGGVQSGNVERARRVAKRLRHGTVWVNTYGSYTPAAEWGGFGLSGNGRELGSKGLDEYIETRHEWVETNPAKPGWFKGEGKPLQPAGGVKAKL
ncbi:probable aldehyde dehydrogenase (mitochondrial) [Sporisorium reilianum f. sp. reilianum]|uniref:Probable aldehyde dehydrogenase (Mitochondrial) n=2 Tax=Sporisorium reilianum f. sp. reilianum TaxID=72559 RepID=A0A2N8ULZ6_9BASI|nr:probable aldehyde dehydrogenase (mitochondrial) [Sporisorium reilianum f. sp. reilianum]